MIFMVNLRETEESVNISWDSGGSDFFALKGLQSLGRLLTTNSKKHVCALLLDLIV